MAKILKISLLISYLIIVINNKDLTSSDSASSTDPIDSVYDDNIIKKITVDVNI
jgi:hypothetical protein